MKQADEIAPYLLDHALLDGIPQKRHLIEIVTGQTGTSSAGFPYVCESSFNLMIEEVPHLFQKGLLVLDWLNKLEKVLAEIEDMRSATVESIARAIRVVRNIIYTAGITAPPDLWLLRHILSAHMKLGLTTRLVHGQAINPASEREFDTAQLTMDLKFMRSRGYLSLGDDGFRLIDEPSIIDLFKTIDPLPEEYLTDMTSQVSTWLATREENPLVESFFRLPKEKVRQSSWIALDDEIEIGYRLLPLVLALRARNLSSSFQLGVFVQDVVTISDGMERVLLASGIIDLNRCVTELGARVFSRGPGPFGIIGTYYPYLCRLQQFLGREERKVWVNRAANVGASQDANRKTFALANDALDRFCKDTGHRFLVFIEHAVGRGEATRQRFERNGEETISYFGADLEDAAIDRAVEAQSLGQLPSNMSFIRQADIAEPQRVVKSVQAAGLSTKGAVMMVGNGFHEVRQQTNERMVQVFKGYHQAGIILIFTEESALTDEDLINTAWNTYHAGFRYVHELSGQGLRSADERPGLDAVFSWRRCAELAGYSCLDDYTSRTRTIYPYPRKKGYNPSISVTHFCVPESLIGTTNRPN